MRFLLIWVLAVLAADGSAQRRWWKTYDIDSLSQVCGAVALFPDTTYRIACVSSEAGVGRLTAWLVGAPGDTVASRTFPGSGISFVSAGAHSVERRLDGTWLWVGSIITSGGEPDGRLVCFDPLLDTLWVRTYVTPFFDGFNAMCVLDDGGACLAGLSNSGQNDFYIVRVDVLGDTLWTRTLGGSNSENAYSICRAQDDGFAIAGYKVYAGGNYDMHVMKIDVNGDLQWQHSYGSPWVDNPGFIEQLPDGRYVLAGARRASASASKRPVLYLLNASGDTLWSRAYTDAPDRSVFYTVPVLMGDGGFAIAGDQNFGAQTRGMLMRTDSSGNMLWRRIYQTNTTIDHYFYDLRRTLDGGFIMAGTAFDSLLVSQDAWLVKTDSFGCLVPGCQVFDGVQEQITDLTGAITLSPNPAGELVHVTISLPPGTVQGHALALSLVDPQGRIVHQGELPAVGGDHTIDLSGFAPGIYYVHLIDSRRWLSGAKLVIDRP